MMLLEFTLARSSEAAGNTARPLGRRAGTAPEVAGRTSGRYCAQGSRSRISRILAVGIPGVNGLGRSSMPGVSWPWRAIASSYRASFSCRPGGGLGSPERMAHLLEQSFQGERLLQELGPGVEHAVPRDGGVAGAGDVQHLDGRPVDAEPRRELAAARAGQHDVGDQE